MLRKRDAQAVFQRLGTLQGKQFQPEFLIEFQFIHAVTDKPFGHSELHDIIVGIYAKRFNIRTELQQMHQAARRILFGRQNTLQPESIEHRTVYGINGPGIDAFHLFLLQKSHYTNGRAKVLADSDNHHIHAVQGKHRECLLVRCINNKCCRYLVLQAIHAGRTDVGAYHFVPQSRKFLGKHVTVIAQTDNDILHKIYGFGLTVHDVPVTES